MLSNKETLFPGEVAQLVGCSTSCVRMAIQRGELEAFRLNERTLIIPQRAVQNWLDASRTRARLPVKRGGMEVGASGTAGRRTTRRKTHNSA